MALKSKAPRKGATNDDRRTKAKDRRSIRFDPAHHAHRPARHRLRVR